MPEVVVTGAALRTGFAEGALVADGFAGIPAFGPLTRFDTAGYRTDQASVMPAPSSLVDELIGVIEEAGPPADTPLLLAAHAGADNAAVADAVAGRLRTRVARTYTGACVAASTAVADAAAMVALGRADRVTVAAGYLVEPDMFATFDAGRALARDGRVRPFSLGRQGMVLGDGVAAVVVESAPAARSRGAAVVARLPGWGRRGDAYHVVRPRPDGSGLAGAISTALSRAGLSPEDIGYVNANGTGTGHNDAAEAAALRHVFGTVPVSSTKSVHGHTLEASGLVELVVTILALRSGRLPVNAGYLGQDPDCALDVVLTPRTTTSGHALTVNTAFGGANTALLVGAP
ncbi:beta-ketoacyl-[acyl-carrier-protein] synthase family protein [Actinokineospora sp. 24-640]